MTAGLPIDPVPVGHSAGDPVLTRALRAGGRALGMHFYGHFVGIEGHEAVDGRSRLSLEGEPEGVGDQAISPIAFATLADLALGAAIRSRIQKGSRLGTVTLTVQHPFTPVAGPVVARGEAEPTPFDQKGARCTLETADGSVVGHAQGWFAALPPPPGRVLGILPWEYDTPPPVT